MNRIRIGDLLIQANLITEAQLQEGLEHQERWGGKLGDALLALGVIDERTLYLGLSKLLSVEYISLEHAADNVSQETLALVPHRLCVAHNLFPVTSTETKIVLACSEPGNISAIEEIQVHSQRAVQIRLSRSREIDWAIARAYLRSQSSYPAAQAVGVPRAQNDMVILRNDNGNIENPQESRSSVNAQNAVPFGVAVTFDGGEETPAASGIASLKDKVFQNGAALDRLIHLVEKKTGVSRRDIHKHANAAKARRPEH